MDPMCAWCYAFSPEIEEFLQNHSTLEIEYIMGGLAPDSDIPMDENLRETISSYWYEIEEKTRVVFNHNYWKENTPYRSTYIACRAVISAEYLEENSSSKMVKAIQNAYYKEARNPSLKETLVDCAISLGFDERKFVEVLNSKETEQKLQEHLNITYSLQVRGFPALFLVNDKREAYPLTWGYTQASNLENKFNKIKGKK